MHGGHLEDIMNVGGVHRKSARANALSTGERRAMDPLIFGNELIPGGNARARIA